MKFQRMLLTRIKKYEISTNATDKNTKFTTKSEDIVICGSCEIFIYVISICEILNVYCIYSFCSMYQNCSEVTVLYDSVSHKLK